MRSLLIIIVCVALTAFQTFAADLASFSLSGAPAINGNDVTFSTTGAAKLRVTVCYPGVARLWLDSLGTFIKDSSRTVDTESWSPVSFTVNDQGTYYQILTAQLSIRVTKSPVQMSIYESDNATLITAERPAGGVGWESTGAVHSYWSIGSAEHFFGLGEDNTDSLGSLDRAGKTRYMWNLMNPRSGYTPANICIPFFMSTGGAGGGYGFFFDNPDSAVFDMGKTSVQYFSWRAKANALVCYFLYGPSFKTIIGTYTQLTGREPLPPVWAFGYIQSKCTYNNWKEIDSVVGAFTTNNLPLEMMVLDYNWPQCYSNFQWTGGPYAGAGSVGTTAGGAKVATYKSEGVRIMVSNSGPETETSCNNYSGAVSSGIFAKCGTGTCTAGWYSGTLYDPTAPNFFSWLWSANQAQNLLSEGVAAWWLDLPEPESEPSNAVYVAGPSAKIHNVFSSLYSKAYYTGQLQYAANTRPFICTRCGFSGIQKYGVTIWSGDNFSDYVSYHAHVPESQSSSLSGIPYWSMDIGGFQTTPNALYQYYMNDKLGRHALLYQRWFQFGCFVPITRAHGVKDCEPYHFTAAVTAGCQKYIDLRYRLVPYIYSYAWQCAQTGLPLQRAMALEFQSDPNTYSCPLQFMFGEDLLVAPVVTESTTVKSVYFPSGTWINYDSGTVIQGPVTATIPAPQNMIPLYVKAGAIIPMAPVQLHLTDSTGAKKPWDPITLDIYPSGSSTFSMYQDDGLTQNYRNGTYTQTAITSVFAASQQEVVTVSESNKLFTPSHYEFQIHFPGQATTPSPVTFNSQAVTTLASQTAYTAAATGMWWDSIGKVLWVKAATSTVTTYVLAVSLNGLPVSTRGLKAAGALPKSFDLKALPEKTGGPADMIQFMVPDGGSSIRIDMFDLAGRQVVTLANGNYDAGCHMVMLSGANTHMAGWYLCRMKAQGFEKTVKVMVNR